jgi:energy-coupling factor transporter ATP-binding protein EcfA2
MTATLTPTRDRPTRLPSFFDSPAPAARVYEAVKVYGRGENEVRALDGVTVEFAARRFTAIMGPSGSGKSTLIHSVAGLNTQRAQICRYGGLLARPWPDRSHAQVVGPQAGVWRRALRRGSLHVGLCSLRGRECLFDQHIPIELLTRRPTGRKVDRAQRVLQHAQVLVSPRIPQWHAPRADIRGDRVGPCKQPYRGM